MGDIEIPNIEIVDVSLLKVDGKNPNVLPKEKLEALKKNIKRFGFIIPIITNKDYLVADGEHRLIVAKELNMEKVPIIKLPIEEVDRRILRQVLNKLKGEHKTRLDIEEYLRIKDENGLQDLIELTADKNILNLLKKDEFNQNYKGTKLSDDFIVPPFSILDARKGFWQNRKREWLENIRTISDTREGVLGNNWLISHINKGTSIFDPVLAEIIYKWFCPEKGTILDPFAGEATKGIVAGILGFNYFGIDIRKEQIDTNLQELKNNGLDTEQIRYTTGNGKDTNTLFEGEADLIFTSPPYFDLELYSAEKDDLSDRQTYKEFIKDYKEIIKNSCKRLKNDRFAVYKVGEIRDKKGNYRNFVSHTIEAFEEAGLKYYNEIVLILPVSSLSLRARRPFEASRKIGKEHQNILVFKKGEPEITKDKIKKIEKETLNFYKDEINEIISAFAEKQQTEEKHEKILVFYKEND